MSVTRHATDFISEKIGQVTKCGATDVAKEFPASAAWMSTFGLCVIFQDHPPAQNRPHALQFVRRVEMAFAEYSRASDHLSDLVSGGPRWWSPYFRALYHFEAAISQLYLAYDGDRKKLGNNYFASDDGSLRSRVLPWVRFIPDIRHLRFDGGMVCDPSHGSAQFSPCNRLRQILMKIFLLYSQ